MKINITSGDCLKELLEERYENEIFIPFREALIKGDYHSKLFSNEFIKERAKALNVSVEEYNDKIACFINLLNHLSDYNEIVLWFGDEPFCQVNRKAVIQALKENNYQGKLLLNIVNEETCEILQTQEIINRE